MIAGEDSLHHCCAGSGGNFLLPSGVGRGGCGRCCCHCCRWWWWHFASFVCICVAARAANCFSCVAPFHAGVGWTFAVVSTVLGWWNEKEIAQHCRPLFVEWGCAKMCKRKEEHQKKRRTPKNNEEQRRTTKKNNEQRRRTKKNNEEEQRRRTTNNNDQQRTTTKNNEEAKKKQRTTHQWQEY